MAGLTLGDAELARYARHIILKEIGGDGQKRLMAAHVVVVGAGGIGSPAIQYLAAAGIGRITLVDDDVVDLSNLQRQTIFATADIGTRKVDAAAKAAAALNPSITVVPVSAHIDTGNVAGLIDCADVVLDGCDNFTTRLTSPMRRWPRGYRWYRRRSVSSTVSLVSFGGGSRIVPAIAASSAAHRIARREAVPRTASSAPLPAFSVASPRSRQSARSCLLGRIARENCSLPTRSHSASAPLRFPRTPAAPPAALSLTTRWRNRAPEHRYLGGRAPGRGSPEYSQPCRRNHNARHRR